MEFTYHAPDISFIYYAPELYLLRSKTRHHLKPKGYGEGDMIRLPRETHDWLHRNFSNRHLAQLYGDRQSLINLLNKYGKKLY